MVDYHMSRRKALIGLGGIATGTVGTIVFGADTTEAASINLNVLEVDDTEYRGDQIESLDVDIDATVEWDANNTPDKIELWIESGVPGTLYEVARESVDVSDATGSVDHSMSANMLESGSLSKGKFELLYGQSERHIDVQILLGVDVIIDGSVGVSDTIKTDATVSLYEQTAEVSIGATGSLEAN